MFVDILTVNRETSVLWWTGNLLSTRYTMIEFETWLTNKHRKYIFNSWALANPGSQTLENNISTCYVLTMIYFFIENLELLLDFNLHWSIQCLKVSSYLASNTDHGNQNLYIKFLSFLYIPIPKRNYYTHGRKSESLSIIHIPSSLGLSMYVHRYDTTIQYIIRFCWWICLGTIRNI